MIRIGQLAMVLVIGCAGVANAQDAHDFHAMQDRGKVVMGVDQYTSVHVFEDLANGGRIELQRDSLHADGVSAIRAHLQTIAAAFHTGDFSAPSLVHMQDVPGTKVMAEKRDSIRYVYRNLPRGGEVRIYTSDQAAIAAVHAFLAFQRAEHHAM